MFCLLAFAVLSILGIFSATHRQLAGEAFDCVFRRITFRPCTTGFKEQMKAKLTGKLLNRSAFIARFFNRHFEFVSWVFFVLVLISTFWVVKGAYNFYLYGSCNGLNKTGFCAFDPSGKNNKVSPIVTSCSLENPSEKDLTLNGVNLDIFPTKNPTAKNKVVFIGCYDCDYTRQAYPLIQKLIAKNDVSFTFAHFPIKDETNSLSEYGYCAYREDQNKFWQFNDALFTSDKKDLGDKKYVDSLTLKFGFDLTKINDCVNSQEVKETVEKQFQEISKTHIFGTPTVFINGQVLVGPKPYRVYERALKGWRFW